MCVNMLLILGFFRISIKLIYHSQKFEIYKQELIFIIFY